MIADHFRKTLVSKGEKSPLPGIDFIYLINLDQRPLKLQRSLEELAPYGIKPNRFSAIHGWTLSSEVLQEVGVKYSPGMFMHQWASYYSLEEKPKKRYEFLREGSYGKTVFSYHMPHGAIGCALSHLSILQDAYDSGYETIWILEDDIAVQEDPRCLPAVMSKLDALVGRTGWDVLYTDMDADVYVENPIAPFYAENNLQGGDLKGDLSFFWRPDIALQDRSWLRKRTKVGEDFLQIASRVRAHSLLVRRSGMQKILNFFKKQHLFLPYDHELALVPGLQCFNLQKNVVTFSEELSDTHFDLLDSDLLLRRLYQHASLGEEDGWKEEKKAILNEMLRLFESCPKEPNLLEIVWKKRPKLIVEVGAFAGLTTYPIARVLHAIGGGTLYAIDAWDSEVAVQGMKGERTIQWWRGLDMDLLYHKFCALFAQEPFHRYVRPLRKTSQEAASFFEDETIDFLVLDGNPSEEQSLEDVLLYFPKVKEGGHIWLQNAQLESKVKSLAFLFEHCHWIEEDSLKTHTLFEKKRKFL